VGVLIVGTLITKIMALGAALVGLSSRISHATVAANKGGSLVGGLAGKGKGLIGKLGGKAGLAGAALGALSVGSTLMGAGSAGDKAKAITENVAGIGGALGGAKLGAMLGSFILPGIGTILGGLGGAIAGGLLGSGIGQGLTGLFSGSNKNEEGTLAKQIHQAASQPALTSTKSQVINDNSQLTLTITQRENERLPNERMKTVKPWHSV